MMDLFALLLFIFVSIDRSQGASSSPGTLPCPLPNGSYCLGDSLKTNIIIRCTSGVGFPANCADNLSGVPPVGVANAPCYQSSPLSANAACSKNGIVYDSNGSYPVPSANMSSSISASASTTLYPMGNTTSYVSGTCSSTLAATPSTAEGSNRGGPISLTGSVAATTSLHTPVVPTVSPSSNAHLSSGALTVTTTCRGDRTRHLLAVVGVAALLALF